jgi:hypothetical protein
MNRKNDGGPAFPVPEKIDQDGGISGTSHPGMSLRDWFAGQALLAVGMAENMPDERSFAVKAAASWCYACADAMLAEREKGDQ